MNFNIIRNLYKKEILDVLRDKKTVIMMMIVPLVLYPLLIIVSMQVMAGISNTMSEQTYKIAFDFEDEDGYFKRLFDEAGEDGYSFEVVDAVNPEEVLREENIDAFIRKSTDKGREYFEIYYMSAVTNSSYATDMIVDVLAEYSAHITEDKINAAGLDAEEVLHPVTVKYMDMSSDEESAGSLLGTLVPFMLITSLLMVTMYPAIDTTAGERERGTLETVLTLPVTNRELIVSKFLAVVTIGIVSAFLNIISMGGVGIYMYKMMLNVDKSRSAISMGQFAPAIVVCILCVFAFAVFISAVSMCVCAFAKSYKEANNYITPLMLVVMFASFVGFIPNVELTKNMALVPVANICLLIRDLLAFKFDIVLITIVLISNVAYGIIAVMLLGRIYNSEAILFGDGSAGVQIFERRSNMKKGGVPTLGDAWLIIAVTAVLIIYAGGAIQLEFGYFGTLGTQAIIAGVPLLAAVYTKKSLRETFRIRLCSVRYFAGAVVMIAGAVMLGLVLTAITSTLFKSSAYNVTESMEYLIGDNLISTLIVVAVAPAICEELMFRGYLFSAMEAGMKHRNAILMASVIFGVYHMSVVKFFTTALLGMVICYISYKSKSIFPGMLMHFINNALSCVVMYYPEETGKIAPVLVSDSIKVSDMLLLAGGGIVLLIIGRMFTKERKNRYKEINE